VGDGTTRRLIVGTKDVQNSMHASTKRFGLSDKFTCVDKNVKAFIFCNNQAVLLCLLIGCRFLFVLTTFVCNVDTSEHVPRVTMSSVAKKQIAVCRWIYKSCMDFLPWPISFKYI